MRVYSDSSCSVLLEKWSQLWGKNERQAKLGEQGTDHAYVPDVNLATVKRNQMYSQGTRDNHANNLGFLDCFWYILLGCYGLYIINFACLWELYWNHSNQQYMGLLLLTLWKFYHCCINFVLYTLRFSMSLTWLQCSNATLNGYFLTHRSGKWGLINDHQTLCSLLA